MNASRRSGGHAPRRALSSVYGFIMIYLLVIASFQAISMSLSSSETADAAAQQAGQVAQMRSLERLDVRLSQGGNVSITNVGLIPSQLSFLLVQGENGSREVQAPQLLSAGSSITVDAGTGASSVAVVTSLGDVFESSQAGSSPPGGGLKTLDGTMGGPDIDAQIYQNPSDPTRLFLAEGSSALAFSTATGKETWSFNASQGEVTDVLPLSDGGVYVSDGYFGDQFNSYLYRLSSAGTALSTYSMRLFRLWTTVEVQFPNGGLPPTPSGSQPVEKGSDALYAYYDGWFFSSSGPSTTSIPADSYELGPSDSSQFFILQVGTNPGGFGCTDPTGNTVTVYAYSAGSSGVTEEWASTVYLNTCNLYPSELLASSAGSGTVALVFAQTYWSQLNYYGGPYTGANPFVAVLSASSGQVLRSGTLDGSGYTGAATDGADVFLAIPSSDEVEEIGSSGSGVGTFYNVGIPASSLIWSGGSLFAISDSEVKVYSPSMSLESAVNFSPDAFYSLSNSKPMEPQMIAPSFIVLNSTSYAALLRNSTGFGTFVVGSY